VLTFEAVWAAMMETDDRMEKARKETDARIEKSRKETDARIEKSQKETDARIEKSQKETDARIEESQRRMEESQKESQKKTDKILQDLSKNIGGLGNSLGRLTEAIFTAELWKKFHDMGYPVSQQSSNRKFYDEGQVLAEVDLFIENGDYAILVEIMLFAVGVDAFIVNSR